MTIQHSHRGSKAQVRIASYSARDPEGAPPRSFKTLLYSAHAIALKEVVLGLFHAHIFQFTGRQRIFQEH